MENKMLTMAQINEILEINEAFKAPSRMMEIVFDRDLREKTFRKFLNINNDISYDWFQGYFEEEQADRKKHKQDFTPASVSNILTKIIGMDQKNGMNMDVCSGTGGITIEKWWSDCIKQVPWEYYPHEHLYWCEELSDRAIPFLLFNLSIRGMNAIVVNCDALSRVAKGVFFIQNDLDDPFGFSTVNLMPYNDTVKKYFGVSKWDEDRYEPHVESKIDIWDKNISKNLIIKKEWEKDKDGRNNRFKEFSNRIFGK